MVWFSRRLLYHHTQLFTLAELENECGAINRRTTSREQSHAAAAAVASVARSKVRNYVCRCIKPRNNRPAWLYLHLSLVLMICFHSSTLLLCCCVVMLKKNWNIMVTRLVLRLLLKGLDSVWERAASGFGLVETLVNLFLNFLISFFWKHFKLAGKAATW